MKNPRGGVRGMSPAKIENLFLPTEHVVRLGDNRLKIYHRKLTGGEMKITIHASEGKDGDTRYPQNSQS